MYGKLFSSMFDGSLRSKGPWEAIVTLQQLVILADPEGVVDMTCEAISSRTSIPLAIIEKGIAALEAPDPDSRNPNDDGRRIVRLRPHTTWGWRIVNHAFYRNLRSEEERRVKRREYHREYARSKRKDRQHAVNQSQHESTSLNSVQQNSTELPHAVSSKQKKKDTASTKGGWVGKFLTALTDVTKGTYPAGRLGSDLKELIHGKGEEPVYAAWLVFLVSPERKYGPSYFAKNYVDYSEPSKGNGKRPGETPAEYQFRKMGYLELGKL